MTSDVELEVGVAKFMRICDGRPQAWAFVWSHRPSTGESAHHVIYLGPQPEPGEAIPLGPVTTSDISQPITPRPDTAIDPAEVQS